jgi:hypothetical protein
MLLKKSNLCLCGLFLASAVPRMHALHAMHKVRSVMLAASIYTANAQAKEADSSVMRSWEP